MGIISVCIPDYSGAMTAGAGASLPRESTRLSYLTK